MYRVCCMRRSTYCTPARKCGPCDSDQRFALIAGLTHSNTGRAPPWPQQALRVTHISTAILCRSLAPVRGREYLTKTPVCKRITEISKELDAALAVGGSVENHALRCKGGHECIVKKVMSSRSVTP